MQNMEQTAALAHQAALRLAASSAQERDRALGAVSEELLKRKERIFAANREDMDRGRREGLSEPLMKRLAFDQNKMEDTLSGIASLRTLPDPVERPPPSFRPGSTCYLPHRHDRRHIRVAPRRAGADRRAVPQVGQRSAS